MNNEPVAYVNNMCNDSIDWKVDPLKLEEGTPLYTTPQDQEKYINILHKLCNANGLGIGRNLLTGEIIPFEVKE